MARVIEEIERLIVRKLDDGLSADEQLELNRAVLRSPEVRGMLEDYTRVDALAGELLRERLDARGRAAVSGLTNQDSGLGVRRRYSRWWWALPGAAAAGLALSIMLHRSGPQSVPGRESPPRRATPDDHATRGGEHDPPSGPIQQAGSISDRAVDENVVYIQGDDGRIYMIEHERVHELMRPASRPAVLPAGGL